MAQKKSVRRVISTPSSKKGSVKIKNTLSSKLAATKKRGKTGTALGKKRTSSKSVSAKKTGTPKKPASKKTKTATKKNVMKTGSKLKAKTPAPQKQPTYKKKTSVAKKTTISRKPSAPKSVVTKKENSASQKKEGSTQTKKVVTKAPSQSVSSPTRSAEPKTRVEPLSPTERYNLGGLFTCAIERGNDPDFKRLRAVLRHLDLPSQEKDNLLRLSQGFMIPKLFAEGIGEHRVGEILASLISFASAEGAYEKKWRDEIRQVGIWLGFFPEQFEQIEQKVLAKR
jgi:hypothetical protein